MTRLPCVAIALLVSCAGATGEGPAAGAPEPEVGCTPEMLAFDSTDAEEIAAALGADFAGAGGIDAWAEDHGKLPVVRFRSYKNMTLEHIELKSIAADLQKLMATSGRVELLAEPGAELDAAHEEQEVPGYELGADLVGSMMILSRDEATDTALIRMYMAEVTLTATESGMKVWMAMHQVKKMCDLPTPPAE